MQSLLYPQICSPTSDPGHCAICRGSLNQSIHAPPSVMSHHSLFHRPKTSDGNLLSPTLGGHKVSFSDSSKSTDKRHSARPSSRPSSSSNSRPSSPAPHQQQRTPSAQRRPSSQTRAFHQGWNETRNLQRINRQSEALWQYEEISPKPQSPLLTS